MSDIEPTPEPMAEDWDLIWSLFEEDAFLEEETDQVIEVAKPIETGRFVMLSDEQAAEFVENQENVATRKKTSSDMNQFRLFLVECGETRDIEKIPMAELDKLFGNFLLGARRMKDHSDYEPSTIKGFMSSLDRYLKKAGADFTVYNNPMFGFSNQALTAKKKELKGKGKGNKPNESEELTDDDIENLFNEEILGVHAPQPLINMLHLNFSLVLGMRGGKEQKDLKWGDIVVERDPDGDEYLVHQRERATKTRTGNDVNNVRKFKPKVWNISNSDRCPVNAYKIYASKRPANMQHPDSPFFLAINVRNPKPGQAWFKNTPLGINSIYNLTKNMRMQSTTISNERNITNHSVRKHLLQKCVDMSLAPTETVQISGHKNVQSINNYSKMNINKQKSVAMALTNNTKQTPCLPSSSACLPISQNVLPVPSSCPPQPSQATSFQHQQSFSSYFGGTTNIQGCSFIFNAQPQDNHCVTSVPEYRPSPPKKYRRILPISDSDSD